MSLHDDYARLTPYELAFPTRSVIEDLSARVAAESGGHGIDDASPETFMTTPAVAELVRELRGPDAPPESTYPFAALLYHAVHFLRSGHPLYLLATEAARALTGVRAREGGEPRPTPSAGYLQLPQHLLWTASPSSVKATEGPAFESLDGFFWTLGPGGMLHTLPITGLRPDRPGFSALPLPPAPTVDAADWLDAPVREDGTDFASTLPGGELDELYTVQAAGEVLKLLARFFALVTGDGAALEARRPPDEEMGGPRPSTLPYTRVTLAE